MLPKEIVIVSNVHTAQNYAVRAKGFLLAIRLNVSLLTDSINKYWYSYYKEVLVYLITLWSKEGSFTCSNWK